MKRLAALLCLLSAPAFAQSNPSFITGQIPTAAQWNSYFGKKADVTGGTINNGVLNSVTINGSLGGSPTVGGVWTASNATLSGFAITGGTITGVPIDLSTVTPTGGTTARTEADLHGDFVRATSFGAKFDGVRVASGGSMTAGSAVLNWSGGSFAATDVGKLVAVDGAGLNGRPLVATITGYTAATQVTLSTTALSTVSTNILAWKSGYQGGPTVSAAGTGYAPGDLITLTGGTASYQGVLQVVGTKAITATVVAGGASGTPGACTITGTTGNANGTTTLFQATGTVSGGGALSGALVVTVAGEYRDNPTNITAEPVTSNCGLVGTTVALTMGVVDILVQQPGAYSVKPSDPISQGSTTGGGSGATFTGVWSTTGSFHYGTDNGTAVQAAITYCQSQVVNNAGGCTVLLPIGTGLTSTTLTVNKSNVSLYSLSRSVGFQMRNTVAANNESFPTRLLYAGADNPGYMLTQVPLLADGHRLAGVDVVGIMFDCAGTQGCGGISIRSATYSTYNASVNEPYPRAYTISGAVASGTRAVVVTDATGIDTGQNVWIPNALAGTYVESVSGNTVTLSSTVYGTGLADGASIYIGGAAWRLDVLGGLNPSDTQANNLWLYGRTSNSPGPCVTINGSAAAGSPQFGNVSLNFFRDVGCVVGAGDMVVANNSDHNYWYNFLPTFVPNTFNIGSAFVANGSLNASNGANRFNWFFNTPGRRAVTFRGTSAGGFTSASVGTQANWLLASAVPRVTVDTAGGATACLSQDTAPAIGCTGALTTTLTGAFTGTGATITGGTFSGATWSAGTFSGTQAGTLNLSGILNAQSGTANFGTNTVAATNNINGPAASNRNLIFQTAGSSRWRLNANSTAEAVSLSISSGTYDSGTGLVRLITGSAHGIAVNQRFVISGATGTGSFASINGTQNQATGAVPVNSGTYNTSTGAVVLTTAVAHGIAVGQTFTTANLSGTGSYTSLQGTFTATAGTTGTTLNYTAATALGTVTITGGTAEPPQTTTTLNFFIASGLTLTITGGTVQTDAGSDLEVSAFSDQAGSEGVVTRYTRSTGSLSLNTNSNYALPTLTVNGIFQINAGSGRQIALMPLGTYTFPSYQNITSAPFYWGAGLASTGVVVSTGEPAIMEINIPSDTVAVDQGGADDGAIAGIHMGWNYGGGITVGNRIMLDMQITQGSPYATAQPEAMQAARMLIVQDSDTGLGASFAKSNEVMNLVNVMTGNAAGVIVQTLAEFDIATRAGSVAPLLRTGIVLASQSDDNPGSHGTKSDHAWSTVSGGTVAGHGWLDVYDMGGAGQQVPFYPTTTIFGVVPWHGQDGLLAFPSSPGAKINQFQAQNGIEFSRVIFNGAGEGAGRAFASAGFSVDDLASIYSFSGQFLGTSSGLTIDTPLYALSGGVTVVGASTTGAVFDTDLAWDETCKVRGIYQLTVVASAVTAVSVLRAPACATNPATLVLKSQSGGVTINTSWTAPAAQIVQIGASGNTLVGTGSALATNATAGFLQLATMAGAPTGTIGAAGKAAVVIDTTNKKICYSTGGGTWECSGAFTP